MSLTEDLKKIIRSWRPDFEFITSSTREELSPPSEGPFYFDQSALHFACRFGNTQTILAIITALGPELAAKIAALEEFSGSTPLHLAAQYGDPESVEAIITALGPERAAEIAASPDKNNRTPLHCAKTKEAVQAIITALEPERAAEIAASPDKYNWTPLHVAARYSSSQEPVQMLIAVLGSDVEDQLNGNCPLTTKESLKVRGEIKKVVKNILLPKLIEEEQLTEKQIALCIQNIGALKEGLFEKYRGSYYIRLYEKAINPNTPLGAIFCTQRSIIGPTTVDLIKSYIDDLRQSQRRSNEIARALLEKSSNFFQL